MKLISIIKKAFLIILMMPSALWAEVSLPKIVSDGMVLQRDTELRIWGWASPGEKVAIQFIGKEYKTSTKKDGKWQVTIDPIKMGGPYTMEINGENKISIKNILVGDVWLCSGQSNMVHYLKLHQDTYAKEINEADFSEIRQFLVPDNGVYSGPVDQLKESQWKSATSENILEFSVVAYFFARQLYLKEKVPIGLINAAIGGSRVEAWISEDGLKDFDDIVKKISQNKDTAYVNDVNRKAAQVASSIEKERGIDKGLAESVKWYDSNYKAKNWKKIRVPGYWEDQGIKDLDGVVWYRHEFTLTESQAGSNVAMLQLGRIVDADDVYINGKLVGRTTYLYPQRRYEVLEDVLKEGVNTLVVRVKNNSGKGGFVPDKPCYLAVATDTIDLKGYWKYKVAQVFKPVEWPERIEIRSQPVVYYNGMIAPISNYAIKGVIWYQGESNTHNPERYDKLFPTLIEDWRRLWQQPQLPFLYVQLTNFMDINYSPEESNWARLRESQRKALSVPNTAMAVGIDLGEWNDIHPLNKKPVGERLALAAEHLVYGKDVVYSGPMVKSATVSEDKIVLDFDHEGSGLVSNDNEELRWFAIAGEDKEFVWAQAKIIEGNKIVVWNETVSDPVFVRYAWADNPDKVNFYNREGLPASPFEVQAKASD